LELAKLISTLKKEAEDVQPYYVSIKLLYDQAHFPEIFSSFAKESKILLDVSEKGWFLWFSSFFFCLSLPLFPSHFNSIYGNEYFILYLYFKMY